MKQIKTEADLAQEDMGDEFDETTSHAFAETTCEDDDEDFFSLFAKDEEDFCDEEIEYYDMMTDLEDKGWIHAVRL